jgi:cell division protein FtsI (penicillin-binding protein 3)
MPNPLPPGAHRVISTMTAAQMRKMMEGVVLYGTGKQAQLNGYSSGGKTGTAQKIDPTTHLYSKTMHIASFAGFAPVNNPVISVAVIIDTPKGPSYYGAAVSAPVFSEVAQNVLEYLSVQHDIDLKAPKPGTKATPPPHEDDAPDHTGEVNAMFAAINDLPQDDPLRQTPAPVEIASAEPQSQAIAQQTKKPSPPTKTKANAQTVEVATPASSSPAPSSAPSGGSTVTISQTAQLRVPSLIGLPVRRVIEQSAAAGLTVQIAGNGTVQEQAPAPGTMVRPGTQIVVRCAR